ncbi:Fic/DOC family protein [Salaquimonas pukyongi]|uniref:Fic/DOC family protein n=1 Tax=Salaquimonas pukyongi TaxID=2712698 RepID=UPI00096BAA3B|nr:Fic family protein [Salaquimonas pukyongi]
MSRYNALEDPLCYPGTQVLRNKADLTEQEELDEFEQLMFQTRADEDLPDGDFDVAHYRALHHHFFQDVYDWAGEFRTIRTGKANNWFCYPEYIEPEMNRIFSVLAAENYLMDMGDKDELAARAAWYLSEINAVHPFREGNGRTQLSFLTMLVRHAGFSLNEDNLEEEAFMNAMIFSFDGDTGPLQAQIRKML